MGNWLWLAFALSLGLSLTPWGSSVLYPFRLFTTWAHECGHAVMTLLVGGSVHSITITPNASGLTQSTVPAARLAQGLVTSAGYLGASALGCVLMAATRMDTRARPILWSVGAFMLFTLLLWIRDPFSVVVVLLWGVALLALARLGGRTLARFVLSLLAIQVALNSVYDIRVLFLLESGRSDAAAMARLFVLPSWFWATAWMLISITMLVWTLRLTRRRRTG